MIVRPRTAAKVAFLLLGVGTLRCFPIGFGELDELSQSRAEGGAGNGAAGGGATAPSTSGGAVGIAGSENSHGGTEAAGTSGESSSAGASGAHVCPSGILPSSTEYKRVFVTSTSSSAFFKSLAGAHERCQTVATSACLDGTWKAWISDSTNSPATYFTRSTKPYVLLNGSVIANDFADLSDGRINVPIERTEYNQTLPSEGVWTGTFASGRTIPNLTCADWTNETGQPPLGKIGRTSRILEDWTNDLEEPCSRTTNHLYCFEQ